jgi:KDO2-lipid IV(A) lauroyltransferase
MATKSKPQIWAEYGPSTVLLFMLRILPRPAAMWIGTSLGSIAFHALGRLRRVGIRNLELAFPDKDTREREQILKNVFRNLGRVLAVFSEFDDLTAENLGDLIVYDPDPAYVTSYERSINEGRGRIILGSHMGNWELQAFAYSTLFESLSFLARRMDNPLIEDRVIRIRTRLGNKQIDKENSAGAILRVLRSGGAVGVLADVNSHPKEGVFVPFFGIPACTASGVAMLALRTNAAIVPMWTIWDKDLKRYRIVYDNVIEPVSTGDREKDIVAITAQYTAAIERVIRAFPDQWIWIHRRWKTRPPGEPDLYNF